MKNRKLPLPFILGICLILAGCILLMTSGLRVHLGTQESRQTASRLEELLPERTSGLPGVYPNSGMSVLEIDGADYVAILEVPAFGVTLSVADRWDSNEQVCSPTRFWGSAYDSTLVIGGADHPQQFGFCDQIEHGALVRVTDMTGSQFSYQVVRIDRAQHAETSWLTDARYDLTLFCRDIYSMEYIAVRCVLANS